MAGVIGVQVEGLEKVNRILEGFGAHSIPERKRAMRESVILVEGDARADAPVNIGELRSSIGSEVFTSAGDEVVGTVGSPLVYAAATEFGQRPHFPPLEPIAYWVRRKLGISGWEGIAVAIRIARKIQRRGVDPNPFLIPAFKKNQGKIVAAFERAVQRLINKG